ncbi:hypothetical protein GGS21DRAFT_284954 [Xylaria nigripes]|nr:hypothetical protein GGS21DRAFT_284954 [Xylaria nigripes]
MAGSRIPTSASKTKPSQAQASRVPRPIPDPSSAYAALESRENSIRLVKPDYTQPLPQRPIDKYITKKDATDDGVLHSQVEKGESSTMHDDKEQGQKAKNIAEGSHGRSKTECPPSVKKSESLGRTRDRSVGQSMSKVDISTQKDKIQDGLAESGHRRHRYEFIDSDESSLTSSPDTNTETDDKAKVDKGKKIDSSERESSMTTMTELMTRAIESPPPQLPLRQQQQQEPAGVDVNALAPQPSQPRHLPRRRPIPLDLRSPAYLGMVSRHTRRYEVEHIAIESSRAEHFDLAGPSSSVYDDHDHGPPPSSPIRVPECVQDGVTGLALYDVWRDTQPPLRSSSQGSINITIPNEEDGFSERRNIRGNRQHDAGYHIGEPLAINRVRSRSALGIRERRNREGRYNFSGESVPVAHEYVPEFQGPGILRSATMNDVNRGRQFTDSSEPTVYRSNNVPSQMDDPPSPFTPLTPFIMRLTGAPAGVEGGAKKLIGEHGWLEDTAASGPKHSQVEKPIGFMGSLRRMAREFVSGIFN